MALLCIRSEDAYNESKPKRESGRYHIEAMMIEIARFSRCLPGVLGKVLVGSSYHTQACIPFAAYTHYKPFYYHLSAFQ